jgi:hypothetical protein
MSSGCSYNRFVGQEEAIKTQWAQVENQLQRRNDLIPNLVETTKGNRAAGEGRLRPDCGLARKLAGATSPRRRFRQRISKALRWRDCSSSSRTIRNCDRARRSIG